MKNKTPIYVCLATFFVFAVAVANLIYSISTAQSVPMAIIIATIMLGIFVACVFTAIKDVKRQKEQLDEDYDEDDDE